MNNNFKSIFLGMLLFTSTSILVSCSSSKKSSDNDLMFGGEDYAQALVSNVKPKWFKGAKRFKLEKMDGSVSANAFFDVNPDINIKQKTLKFVVTTPEDSEAVFDIDIPTGQHFYKNRLCKQKDLTNKFYNNIYKPNFTQGIVPRYLDQLGEAQKIIVFGDKDYYQSHFRKNYFDARIVGGYIELFCPSGRCLKGDDWSSRLVLIGVQPSQEKYKDVNSLEDLQSKVDWNYTQAFIENGQGSNVIAGEAFNAYKMGALISSQHALSFMAKNSIYFSVSKMKNMRKACYKLYDHMWSELGNSKVVKVPKTTKEIKEQALKLSGSHSYLEGQKYLFSKRFARFFGKYHKEYRTCSRFVYPASINDNADRHWFFTYMNAISHLHNLGYYYNCGRNSWFKNPILENGKKMKSVKDEFRFCSERSIDNSMDYAILKLKLLREKSKESYRYIEYDKGQFGTHNKIYGWVRVDNKTLNCNDESLSSQKAQHKTFPSDIRWKKRASQGKTKSSIGDIIY